ncbi:MAG: adenylate/guanylate cyclase domain-containing protein, partial [Anaerolineae bacterium]|nr:adenylate/guanylate cyclase domain-containing protein [Anaerolineae bacterium]
MQFQPDIHTYIPSDRVLALAEGRNLLEKTQGTALFADISGFTPLTEALRHLYGDKLGVERLIDYLNQVFEALIAVVELHGGSVIGFSGDAITCWFDHELLGGNQSAAHQAVTAALGMQQAMEDFAVIPLQEDTPISLRMKASVATGPAWRFVVGDPTIQLVDVLAGKTILRLATGEQLANQG